MTLKGLTHSIFAVAELLVLRHMTGLSSAGLLVLAATVGWTMDIGVIHNGRLHKTGKTRLLPSPSPLLSILVITLPPQ